MFEKSMAATLPAWTIAGLLTFAPVLARAQPTPTDPSDPKARVPAAQYVSPLRGYQGLAPGPIAPWRETNELVRQRGGWRAYAGEARAPSPAASAASGGHAGHHMK